MTKSNRKIVNRRLKRKSNLKIMIMNPFGKHKTNQSNNNTNKERKKERKKWNRNEIGFNQRQPQKTVKNPKESPTVGNEGFSREIYPILAAVGCNLLRFVVFSGDAMTHLEITEKKRQLFMKSDALFLIEYPSIHFNNSLLNWK